MADGGERRWNDLQIPGEAKTLVYVLGVGFLVCGLSLIFVPTIAGQVTHDEVQLEAALVIQEHAEEHDREWRDNAVFSSMGDNRMCNYFVSGESRQYRYVQGMYPEFVADDDPDGWKGTLDGRFGYVTADRERGLSPERLGARGERSPDHYRMLYVSDDGDLAVLAIVEGATIEGTNVAGEQVTVRTDVEVDGASFVYEREIDVDDGEFAVVVPYPGEYTVRDSSVEVTTQDVEEGATVRP